MEIANKMRFHGEKMEDLSIVEKILRSLTPKYDYVVCSIEESKYIDEFSLDELQSSLLVHEQKMNWSSTMDEQALKASTLLSSLITKEGVEVEVEVEVEEGKVKAIEMVMLCQTVQRQREV